MGLNLDLALIDAHIAGAMEEYVQTKDFLLFSKLVLNAQVMEKK